MKSTNQKLEQSANSQSKRVCQEALWQALAAGDIDLVVSDHSPCTADLKLLDQGDFMKAWGGIASLQFGTVILIGQSCLSRILIGWLKLY